MTGSASGTLGTLFVDLSKQGLQLEFWFYDLGGRRHYSVSHRFIDDLDMVRHTHGSSPQNLVCRLADVIGNKLHVCETPFDVHLIPAVSNASKQERVIELSCPKEGDVVNRELLACHIHPCH